MPCILVGNGKYKIKDYPKVYPTKAACEKRVSQMEIFKHLNQSDKKAAYEKIKANI